MDGDMAGNRLFEDHCFLSGNNIKRRLSSSLLNRHGQTQTCLCANASAYAPTHADRRKQAQTGHPKHLQKDTAWFSARFCVSLQYLKKTPGKIFRHLYDPIQKKNKAMLSNNL